jgi:hypothetical protein
MWWEMRKLAVVVAAVDVLVALAALLACVAVGAVSAVAVGTAIFAGAFVLAFAAIGAGNGSFRADPSASWRFGTYNSFIQAQVHEMEARSRTRDLRDGIIQLRGMNWTILLGIAAATLFAISLGFLFA